MAEEKTTQAPTQQAPQPETPPQAPPAEEIEIIELQPKEADVLLRIYMEKRLNYQSNWYKERNLENDYNTSLTLRWTALIMAISTVAASSSFVATDPAISATLATITALLPPLAALISSFRELYQWERQSNVYQDTILGLEEAKLNLPDEYVNTQTEINANKPIYPEIYTKLVQDAEEVFEKEANQWGQITLEKSDDPDRYNKHYENATNQAQGQRPVPPKDDENP